MNQRQRFVDALKLQQSRNGVELVGELVGLGAQHIHIATGLGECLGEVDNFSAATKSGHSPFYFPFMQNRHAVDHHRVIPQPHLLVKLLLAMLQDFQQPRIGHHLTDRLTQQHMLVGQL